MRQTGVSNHLFHREFAMPILDFTELADADVKVPLGEGLENLIRELGERLGLRPEWSGRGTDQGRDLYFTERRHGAIGTTKFRWLVSCKDKAQSGRSVTEQDVGSVVDKLVQHAAQGFLLVTTSTASSGLKATLDGIGDRGPNETKVWDRSELESLLLQDAHLDLVKRYLPKSYAAYRRLGGIPQVLDALRLMTPEPIFEKIHTVIQAYQAGDAWLTGERIWPHDDPSIETINLALTALLEKGDASTAASILSRHEIEFDAFDATLSILATLRPAQAQDLCRALVKDANNKGPALHAFHFFVQHFQPNNEEQIRLAADLDKEDLSDLYSMEVENFIVDDLLNSPEKYAAWSEIDALSSSTRVSDCIVDRISFKPDKSNARIEFAAKLVVSLELVYARESAGSHSVPGDATGYFDAHGIYIEDFTVDTSSIFE